MSDPAAPVVGILGTGDFSRSLARRLVAFGYVVVVGSRTPQRFVSLFPAEAEVTHNGTRTTVHTHRVTDICFTDDSCIITLSLPTTHNYYLE